MPLSYADVATEAAGRLRLDQNDSSLSTLINGWVNQTIQDIHSRHDWFWALNRAIVQTVIDKTAGTVSVSAGATAVTGSGTAFDSLDEGKFIQFQNSNDWYRISSVSSATALVIEGGYNGTSALSAGTYSIRKLFYSMPSTAEKILTVTQAQTWKKLRPIHFRDYDTLNTFSDSTGKATAYFVYGLDSSGYLRFSIMPHADEAYNLEVRFKVKATESALTLVPEKWRNVYVDGTIMRGLEYIAIGQPEFMNSLVRNKRLEYEQGILRMLADEGTESDYHPRLMSSEAPVSLPTPRLPDGLSIPVD